MIKIKNVDMENNKIYVESKLTEYETKKVLIKSVLENNLEPNVTFETIKFIIDAEIVHKWVCF